MTDQDLPDLPPAPPGLHEDGQRLWTATVEVFDLAEHELALLEQACHCRDSLAALNDALHDDRANIKLLAERRQTAIVFGRLVAQIGLPAGVEDDDGPKQQRRAARGVYQPRTS